MDMVMELESNIIMVLGVVDIHLFLEIKIQMVLDCTLTIFLLLETKIQHNHTSKI